MQRRLIVSGSHLGPQRSSTLVHRGGAHPPAQRSVSSSLPFDFRDIPITSPGDREERQASDAAASLAPLGLAQSGAREENRERTDAVAASLAPGSSGEALPAEVREPLEKRLGHAFGHVRIHADGTAASSARSLQAGAYAVGRHVMFDAGRYAPHTPAGRRMLAHELTHVAQADAGAAPMISRQPADPKTIAKDVTTDKLISDDIDAMLDELIAASKVLAPFINKSKLRAVKGSISMLDTSEFSTAYHKEKGDGSSHAGSEKDPDIQEVRGLTQKKDPHNILLRRQISNFGDALHEAIHRISFPGFTTIAPAIDEGTTDHFTRKVLDEAGLKPPKNKYDRKVQSIEELMKLVPEKTVGEAYFDKTKIQTLGNAVGTNLWVKWIQAMGKEDFDKADALILRGRIEKQLREQIEQGKAKGSGAATTPKTDR